MQSLKVADPGTYEHCLRVGEYSRRLAQAAGLNEYQQKVAEFSGMFHDVGKVAVPKSIIYKPAKLTEEEMHKMREHPIMSAAIIEPLQNEKFFADLVPGVKHHHERLDGLGYPDKLKGEHIPLIARVILIVDTYDAMAETRAYRKGLPDDVIYAELKRCSGTQFDEALVKVFFDAHKFWKSAKISVSKAA